jgi:hypothetical protein
MKEIKRTYFYNTSKLTLITIPIINGVNENYLNIFITNEYFLITKFSLIKQVNGNILHVITSLEDELYYQFELDTNNRIGKWKIEKAIPFKETLVSLSNNNSKNKIRSLDENLVEFGIPCASKPFNECMNCLIIQTCGSDWVCAVACAVFVASCVGGAAVSCIIL